MNTDRSEQSEIIAVDLGGTRLRAARVNLRGEILDVRRATTDNSGPEAVLEQIESMTNALYGDRRRSRAFAIGIGAPGPLDPRRGIVLKMPNLAGWENYPLRDRLESTFEMPVYLQNDASLASLGEWRFGCGEARANPFVYYTVSTGIGGGIILDGRILEGARGLAGELGHVRVSGDGPACGLGHPGCLEAVASGTGIARRYMEATAGGSPSLSHITSPLPSAKEIAELASVGDEPALQLFDDMGTALGMAIGNVINVIDPELICIGGGLSAAKNLFWEPLQRQLEGSALTDGAKDAGARVRTSRLGDTAGLLGALELIRISEHA